MQVLLVLHQMRQPSVAWAALKVSLVVGTFLNLLNNGEQFWLGSTVGVGHIAMNYLVPYCVSSYSAARHACGHLDQRIEKNRPHSPPSPEG